MPCRHYAIRHPSGFQVAADQPQPARVVEPIVQLSHQHVVVHAVEECLEIHVHNPVAPRLDILRRFAHGIVRATSGPEAMAVRRESRIEQRLQHLPQQLLPETVEPHRDA